MGSFCRFPSLEELPAFRERVWLLPQAHSNATHDPAYPLSGSSGNERSSLRTQDPDQILFLIGWQSARFDCLPEMLPTFVTIGETRTAATLLLRSDDVPKNLPRRRETQAELLALFAGHVHRVDLSILPLHHLHSIDPTTGHSLIHVDLDNILHRFRCLLQGIGKVGWGTAFGSSIGMVWAV